MSNRLQICFFFNAQRHQLLHGIATAVEMARQPDVDVTVASPAAGHIDYARELVARLGGVGEGATITFVHARSPILERAMARSGSVVPPKVLSLAILARWLNGFDAIALPERTSILLKTLGVRRPRFIHLDHGAGDRAAGFDPRIRRFDFVLMAGPKHRERLASERLIRPDAHAVVGYPKFAAADAIRDADWTPFADARPVVLYNAHFSTLGSWERCAAGVMAAFAAQDRYNLIVAPHVRLLDGTNARARWDALLARYADHPRIHIDRGSDRAIDMTFTAMADLYLGDVSSQVYEYLRTPKPCLFIDPHGIDWAEDENYAHWHFGRVVRGTDTLIAEVDRAFADHDRYRPAQLDGIGRTFLPDGGAGMAADAIATYLRRTYRRAAPLRPAAENTGWAGGVWPGRMRRAAIALPLLATGWFLNHLIEPDVSLAAADPFVDRAVASHRTTLLRQGMATQLEARVFDPVEIRRATGIKLPKPPPHWRIGDVQIYPSTRGDIVQVMLIGPRAAQMSLVAMRIDTDAGNRPVVRDRATARVAYWERGDTAYALVGQLPSAALTTLADELARDGAAHASSAT